MWGLTPCYQHRAAGGVLFRAAGVVDAGAGEAARGPGWLGLYLGRQVTFYPALTLSLYAVLFLLL